MKTTEAPEVVTGIEEAATHEAPAAPVPAESPKPKDVLAFRFYRCVNCDDGKGEPGYDFSLASDQPAICPQCGIRKDDPRVGGAIIPLVIVHWEPPHPVLKRGKNAGMGIGHVACNPKRAVGTNNMRSTGDVAAVNCPACLHAADLAGAAGNQFDGQYDFEIEAPSLAKE